MLSKGKGRLKAEMLLFACLACVSCAKPKEGPPPDGIVISTTSAGLAQLIQVGTAEDVQSTEKGMVSDAGYFEFASNSATLEFNPTEELALDLAAINIFRKLPATFQFQKGRFKMTIDVSPDAQGESVPALAPAQEISGTSVELLLLPPNSVHRVVGITSGQVTIEGEEAEGRVSNVHISIQSPTRGIIIEESGGGKISSGRLVLSISGSGRYRDRSPDNFAVPGKVVTSAIAHQYQNAGSQPVALLLHAMSDDLNQELRRHLTSQAWRGPSQSFSIIGTAAAALAQDLPQWVAKIAHWYIPYEETLLLYSEIVERWREAEISLSENSSHPSANTSFSCDKLAFASKVVGWLKEPAQARDIVAGEELLAQARERGAIWAETCINAALYQGKKLIGSDPSALILELNRIALRAADCTVIQDAPLIHRDSGSPLSTLSEAKNFLG